MLKQIFRLAFALFAVLSLSRLPASAQNYVFQSSISGGLISKPVAVAADTFGNLWVAGDNRLVKYDAIRNVALVRGADYNGAKGLPGVAGSDNAQFTNPVALTVDRNGDVFVADYGNARIQEFDTNGAYLRTMTSGPNFQPIRLAVNSVGTLYAEDQATGAAIKFNAAGAQIGTFALPAGQSSFIVIDKNDNLYAFKKGNTIEVYDRNELHTREITLQNFSLTVRKTNYEFHLDPSSQNDLAIDSNGNLYAIINSYDLAGNYYSSETNILVFDTNGNGLNAFPNTINFAMECPRKSSPPNMLDSSSKMKEFSHETRAVFAGTNRRHFA